MLGLPFDVVGVMIMMSDDVLVEQKQKRKSHFTYHVYCSNASNNNTALSCSIAANTETCCWMFSG